MVKEYLPDYHIIDALSDFEFYTKGVVEHPINFYNSALSLFLINLREKVNAEINSFVGGQYD